MINNSQKFLFLGVMIIPVILGNSLQPSYFGYRSEGNNKISNKENTQNLYATQEPPLFLLSAKNQTVNETPEKSSTNEITINANSKENIPEVMEKFKEPETVFLRPKENSNITSFIQANQKITESIFYKVNNEPLPLVVAEAAFLADLETGEIYFDLNGDKRWPLASISKIVSAAVIFKKVGLSEQITLAPENFLVADNSVTKHLKIGDTLTVGDLLKAMLVVSSNEAAEAVATFYGRANFISEMNRLAGELDLNSTYFNDPTGLSSANQSTPEEMRKIALKIFKEYPEIWKISKSQSVTVKIINSGEDQILTNINLFSSRPDLLGGKTGYTDEAGNNLLSIFSYEDRPMFIIIFGADDKYGETEKIFEWFKRNYSK